MAEAENPREQNVIPENLQLPVLFRGQKALWNQCWGSPQPPFAYVDVSEGDSGTQASVTEPRARQGLRMAECAHRLECACPGQEPKARGGPCNLQQCAVCGHRWYHHPGPKHRISTRLREEVSVRLGVQKTSP